jgi:hypothetical protein
MVHDRSDVVGGAVLGIAVGLFRHVGRRIAARAESDAAVALAEVAHLRFPRTVVGRELVDEHDGLAGAGLLVPELHAVVGSGVWHRFLRVGPDFRSYAGVVPGW